ncbi:MAG: carotenoid biosynthesis protein [Actinomycetota bacterium]|nr:carotenoid biosynthesis protein [Actinomycetota bacterium]
MAISTALAAAAVALQVVYPLSHGVLRDRLTIAVVVGFSSAVMCHAWEQVGAGRALAVLGATAGPGLAAEIVGVHTGYPFGTYHYLHTLGPEVTGVPLLVGLAWTMLAWPAALVARRLARTFVPRVVWGAAGLATWDLFLDPQMVAAGHWQWYSTSPHLPGVPEVPLTNFAGWLIVATAISLLMQALLAGQHGIDDRTVVGLYLWTYFSSVAALGLFLGLAAAAAWGGLGMGLVALPALTSRSIGP